MDSLARMGMNMSDKRGVDMSSETALRTGEREERASGYVGMGDEARDMNGNNHRDKYQLVVGRRHQER